jgi:hypothetical protein
MSNVFASTAQLTVVTQGPGSLSLLSWGSSWDAKAGAVGAVKTNKTGNTLWVVSFSHNYLHFAIKWSGEGKAWYQVGEGADRKAVGRDWKTATTIHWSNRVIVTEDVSAQVATVPVRYEFTTIWIVPEGFVAESSPSLRTFSVVIFPYACLRPQCYSFVRAFEEQRKSSRFDIRPKSSLTQAIGRRMIALQD